MENLVVIRTLGGLRKLQEYLADKDFIAYDTETTGVEKGSEIIGLSVAHTTETGYYVILSYWDPEQQKLVRLETHEGIREFIATLVPKNLIMQNAGFDCGITEDNFGIDLMPSVHTDTLALGHLLNENRSNGLKERGVELFGEDAAKEQKEMKESVYRNGGVLTKETYELYKADAELMAKYGAKDAILTLKIFYNDIEVLQKEGLDKFFYEDETMPLLRGPTYELNRTGLRVDPDKLQGLKQQLEADCLEAKGFIYQEIAPYIKTKYKGTSKANTFNIGASGQRAWLLFFELKQEFKTLTKEGRALCKALDMDIPYTMKAKREFIEAVVLNKDRVWDQGGKWNPKTKKIGVEKKVRDPWYYTACGKETLVQYADKYKWVAAFLKYSKDLKLLNTYVEGIQSRARYNIIRPQFLQHGTTSGRYSSKNPNFQNLPRDDKRVKACIVARSGKVFVGADQSQLEPRVFTAVSQDTRLMQCFKDGDDFYSVIGADVFNKSDCTLKKDDSPNSFPVKHKRLRDVAKVIALATPYGTTPFQLARQMGKPVAECEEIISNYFSQYPSVEQMMLDSHEQAKTNGAVYSLFGRPRRMPLAKKIKSTYGDKHHAELPYEVRNMLNLAMNHRVQSTAASIMNRAAIAFYRGCRRNEAKDSAWKEVHLVMQVHDELIAEGPKSLAEEIAALMKYCMEKTTQLPGVDLIAEPKIAEDIASLK